MSERGLQILSSRRFKQVSFFSQKTKTKRSLSASIRTSICTESSSGNGVWQDKEIPKESINTSTKKHEYKKHKTRRTLKNKGVGTSKSKSLTIVGTNANGIVSKLDSLALVVKELNPAVIILQETKVKRKGQVSLPSYEIFELIRESDSGGSLLTAIHCDLSPVLISETEEGMEILVVKAQVEGFECTFINAYGP